MSSQLGEIFSDNKTIQKIQAKLPILFNLAELEASRAGKIGMEVGSLREKIIIGLLIYKYGEQNIDVNIPITEPEVDVRLFGKPISIKTITGQGGVKAVWTVDAESARGFISNYVPKADILLVQIQWGKIGNFYYIPLETQLIVFQELGRDRYFNLPKPGTNPRGVEFSKEALVTLQGEKGVEAIDINWKHSDSKVAIIEAYRRWVDYWREE
jgi:hypothetical protein